MKKFLAIATLLLVSALPVASFAWSNASPEAAAPADRWSADDNHTEINFSVKHFFTPVTGRFGDFELVLDYDPANPTASVVEARIAVASVDTGNDRRDEHLRSGDFFEAEQHPYITFRSSSVRKVSDHELIARGGLTIKGVTKEIELPISLLGTQVIPEDMQGMLGGSKEVASFRASANIDRRDYGVGVGSWAATLVVGSDVSIEISLEAHRK